MITSFDNYDNYVDNFDIKKTTASSTYGKLIDGPLDLKVGKEKKRLIFSPQEDENVYVEVIKNGAFDQAKSFFLSKMDRKFVKCKHRGQTVYINVNSLAHRIGISPQEIYLNPPKDLDGLNAIIEDGHKNLIETEQKSSDFFDEIVRERYIEVDNEIRTEDGETISRDTLRKMIGITGIFGLNSEKDEETYSLKGETKKGYMLHLKKQEDSEWPAMTLFTRKPLGNGSFGAVEIVQEISLGRMSIAKIADYNKEESTKNEYNVLSKIFQRNPHAVGIQEKPTFIFDFELEGNHFYGYVAKKYQGSLSKIIADLDETQRIDCARQLISGSVELAAQKVCHGDIKEENCLYKENPDGSLECVHADFGGARDMEDRPRWPRTGTSIYRCNEDTKAFEALYDQFETEKNTPQEVETIEKIQTLALRRDVYAMGLVLRNLLIPIVTGKRGKALNQLINKMLIIDWKKRPSAFYVQEKFEKIFS